VAAIDHPLTSPENLESALTPRTRGICVMHYGGYPCAMDAVMDLARRNGLWVVEDAAHAPGARCQGISCGAWGDVGCFSFFGNKNITCGEGGIIVTASDRLADRIRRLRSHGMSSLTWDRYLGHQFSYDVTDAGYNYRIDDLRASILRVQLSSLEEWNRRREERTSWYRELLCREPHWILPFTEHEGESSYHLFPIVLDEELERSSVMQSLASRGVQSSIHYPPVHRFTCYRKPASRQVSLRITESLGKRLLSLPLYPQMSREQVEYVHKALREAVREIPRLSGAATKGSRKSSPSKCERRSKPDMHRLRPARDIRRARP
jgi:dTDP-4-amino-4,6-dideoxygalactose transaminase